MNVLYLNMYVMHGFMCRMLKKIHLKYGAHLYTFFNQSYITIVIALNL